MSNQDAVLATHDALRAARHFFTCISLPLAISALIVVFLCTREAAKAYSMSIAMIVILGVMADVEMHLIWDPLFLLPKICSIRYHPAIPIPGCSAIHYVLWVAFSSLLSPNFIACFLYRHQAVLSPDSRWRLSFQVRCLVMLVLTGFCAAMVALLWVAEVADASALLQIFLKEVQLYRPGMSLATVSCFESRGLTKFGAAAVFVLTSCLLFIILATLHTFSQLKKVSSMSEKMRLFHRTMTRVLVIQSTVPLILLILPFTIQSVVIFTKITDSTLLSACVLFTSLHSPVHSLTLLVSTPIYRKKVLQIVRQLAGKGEPSTTVFKFSKISLY